MTDTDYIIRRATIDDIDFIVETIVQAEKSGSDLNGFASIFNLSASSFSYYMKKILEEEIDGCELSLSSFLVVDVNGKPVAAVGGWLEGYYDDIPSTILKSNLIGYTFPKEHIMIASSRHDLLTGLLIEREIGAYQIEYVYVSEEYRGNNLLGKLILKHVEYAKSIKTDIQKMQVQVLENNKNAINGYLKSGFIIANRFESKHADIIKYIPYNVKLLMEKTL